MARNAIKRKVERIRLATPLQGRAGSMDVVFLDISLLGCRLEHPMPLRVNSVARLAFRWEGEPIEIEATVVRCSLATFASGPDGITVYHSGLKFSEAATEALLKLRELITAQISRALDEQKANARGDMPKFLSRMAIFSSGLLTADAAQLDDSWPQARSLPHVRIARERGYVTYTLEKGRWRKKRTRTADQPEEGFTVWAYEDDGQLEQLSKAYEVGNAELRSLIRACAELSLIVDDSIPPQRFSP